MAMDADELNNRFTYHAPKGDQPKRYEELRANARHLAVRINELCPDSREKSLALTCLEESVMWANASIARREQPATPAAEGGPEGGDTEVTS